jgi:hypothetical protein
MRLWDSIMFKPLGAAFAATLALLGCAVERAQVGASGDQVIATYGAPSRVVALATGSRLQYSRQPAGQAAVMVDLDGAGKVVSVRQVLNAKDFERIGMGQWTRETTERELGRPAYIRQVANWTGDILVYRWRDAGVDMLLYVHLDAGNVVQQVGQGMEYRVVRQPGRDD